MIAFSCPACAKAYEVADDKAGKRTRCPRCGTRLTVPTREVEVGQEGAGEGRPGVRLPRLTPPVVAGLAAALMATLLLAKTAYNALRPGPDPVAAKAGLPRGLASPPRGDDAPAREAIDAWFRGRQGHSLWTLEGPHGRTLPMLRALRAWKVRTFRLDPDAREAYGRPCDGCASAYVLVDYSGRDGTPRSAEVSVTAIKRLGGGGWVVVNVTDAPD